MAALKNTKHERFAQEMAKGKSATDAMRISKCGDARNSTRLMKNEEIAVRIVELQRPAAERAAITVDSLTQMYIADRELALALKQPGAARACVDSLAKLHGLSIDRKEIGRPGDFQRMTDDELDQFISERSRGIGAGDARARATTHPGNAGVRGRLN